MVDERHGGPITIGYGRYGPNQSLTETMAVDDTMIVLEGRLTVTMEGSALSAGPSEIIYMPKGDRDDPVPSGRRGHCLRHLSSLAGSTRIGRDIDYRTGD